MNQRKPKKVVKIEDYLNSLDKTKKQLYAEKYQQSIGNSRGKGYESDIIESLNLRTGNYSLRTRILKNKWVGNSPATKATKWLHREVFKDPSTYRYNKQLMYQSGLFIFEYKNPKFKDTSVLPWFDKHPLVISLGPISTNLGVRNMGFNLHLLPPRIRIIVICGIFEIYKKLFRYQIFYKRNTPIQINYKRIVKTLDKYGVRFAIRMYIPARMRQIVRFPLKDWHKAIFIPSRSYYGIRAAKLIQEWRTFNRKNGFRINPRLDWQSKIKEK